MQDLCRKHGFSEASYDLWRSKFGGMNVSDAKRLKELSVENGRLKKLLAESLLENEVTRTRTLGPEGGHIVSPRREMPDGAPAPPGTTCPPSTGSAKRTTR